MARGDQLARQWKLIQALMSSQVGRSASDFAQDLKCHPRTVYRDLEALQLAGFPLYTQTKQGRSLWSFLSKAKHQIPLPLDLTELMALYFSRDMLKILKDTVFYDSLETLFQKIKFTLPEKYVDYLEQLEKGLEVGLKPHKAYGKFKQTFSRLNEAVSKRRYVTMRYFTMSRRQQKKRTVAPYKIWFYDGTFYLIGYCLLRKDIRLFAIDRIKSLEIVDETFQIPDDFNTEDFMQSSFGVFKGKPTEVKIRFEADVAGYITEKIWHASQKIQSRKDGSILFSATVAGTDEIKIWIRSWGAKAKVLSPTLLADQLKDEAAAVFALYGEANKRKLRTKPT